MNSPSKHTHSEIIIEFLKLNGFSIEDISEKLDYLYICKNGESFAKYPKDINKYDYFIFLDSNYRQESVPEYFCNINFFEMIGFMLIKDYMPIRIKTNEKIDTFIEEGLVVYEK